MSLTLVVILFLKFLIALSEAATQTKIIGGESVSIEDYPYQISMRWTYGVSKPLHFCGGSIVSRYHIVTAAHCVHKKASPNLLKYMQIYTGTSRSDSTGNTGKVYSVKSVTVHPKYTGPSTMYFNDIAIVKLNEPIEFNEYQQSISLPTQDVLDREESEAIITGWGSTKPSSQDTPLNLQKAAMSLVTSSRCQSQLPFNLRSTQVCAVQKYGVGVCTGDSGGPLVADDELIGIASYVVECGKGYPDVYTNVYSYLDFIRTAMDSSSCIM